MKKMVRIACLLVALVCALSLEVDIASASSPYCEYYCSGWRYIAWCHTNIQTCCGTIQFACPDPLVFEGGACTDGQNYCYV